jgi:ribosomal protein S6--L-glutamate ligase
MEGHGRNSGFLDKLWFIDRHFPNSARGLMISHSSKRLGVIGVADGWSSNRLADAVSEKTGRRHLIQMDHVRLDVHSGEAYHEDLQLSSFDALIAKKIGASYSPLLTERMKMLKFLHDQGTRIFSNPDSMIAAMDRLSCTLELRRAGIPMPPTVITEDVDQAVTAAREFGKAILKPLYTSKARGMAVVESNSDARATIEAFQSANNPLIYIQKMLELPGYDLGLVFLGGEYVETYARVSNGNSWNTTIRSGGRYEPHAPTAEVIDLARRAQDVFKLDFTCVDIAETSDGPVVFEVSAFGGFKGLHQAHGMDAASLYVDYVLRELDR